MKNREILLRRVDGTIISVSVTALARFNARGEVVCINGLVENITGQRIAEEDARTMSKEIHDIIIFLPVPVFMINGEGAVIAWNSAMERLTGVSSIDMAGGKEYARAFGSPGENRPALIDVLDNTDDSLKELYTVTRQQDRAVLIADIQAPYLGDGSGGWLRTQACSLKDPSRRHIGAIECIRRLPEQTENQDFTGQGTLSRFTESGVRGNTSPDGAFMPATEGNVPSMISHLYLSNARKHAGDGSGILDNSARCVWTNNALSNLFGVDGSEAIVGKSIAQFTVEGEQKQILDRISAARMSGSARFPFPVSAPGKGYSLGARISVIADEQGNLHGFLIILRDPDP